MRRDTFVRSSLLLFALVLVSFLTMGFGRLVVPYRTARLLAAPAAVASGVLALVLFVRAALAVTGIRPFEE